MHSRRGCRRFIENLETRQLLSVSHDAAGWTVVTPSADSKVIYVSSSAGSDTNSGLSESSPVQTLSKAQSLVRAGYPDWVLLKRGDTFGTFGEWRKWGRSAQEPMYISAYGTGARPQINTGTGWGLITYAHNGATGQSIDNLIISSLSFYADTYNGTNGTIDTGAIRLYCQGQNVTIEDCKIYAYREGLTLDPANNGLRNIVIRRNVITDCYALPVAAPGTTYNAHGIWIGGTSNGVTIEQNVLDHNGWRMGQDTDRTYFNHDVYIYNSAQNVTVRENLITRASFYGIKMNGGGTAYNNFFARNAESIYLENPALIESNVVTEAVVAPDKNWGVGFNTQKASSATIRKNLVFKNENTVASGVAGIQLFNNGTPFSGLVEDNVVYNWRNGIKLDTPGNGVGSVIVRNNKSQLQNSSSAAVDQNGTQSAFSYSNNIYYSQQSTGANRINGTFKTLSQWIGATGEINPQYTKLTFPAASRDIQGYAAAFGIGTTFENFIDAARAMDKSNWNAALMAPAVNDWLRAGFGMAAISTPTIVGAAFSNQRLPISIDFTFSGDIGGAPPLSTLALLNQTTNQVVTPSSVTYDSTTRKVSFWFTAPLTDGRYLATYNGSFNYAFTSLSGDGDGDGKVNTSDFNAIASNFGGTNKTFAQGDFNYDGSVNSADFAIFMAQYGRSFPSSGGIVGDVLS